MEMTRVPSLMAIVVVALVLALGFPSINAQASAPAPAPTSDGKSLSYSYPNLLPFAREMGFSGNDGIYGFCCGFAGVAIDQGIAYVLMLVALAITYMIH